MTEERAVWLTFAKYRIKHWKSQQQISEVLWIDRCSYIKRESWTYKFQLTEFITLLLYYKISLEDFLEDYSNLKW